MPISAPEVTIESIIQSGFADLITNAATDIPIIFQGFPTDYINDTIDYLTNGFKVNTVFNYYYDPAVMPTFNIVLASEAESPNDRQMYLNDAVETAQQIPNTEPYESHGSDWTCTVAVIVRAEKTRQCLILYNILKWLFLKNRIVLETAGIKASKFSGSDLAYSPAQPTLIYNRQIKMDCRIYNTVDTPVLSPAPEAITVDSVQSAWPAQVRVLPEEEEVLGGGSA